MHMHLALKVAARAYVMSRGHIAISKSAAHLRRDRHLVEASYLGENSSLAQKP
jgi:ABC-type branched-subunit amino acid transport system ATPase component